MSVISLSSEFRGMYVGDVALLAVVQRAITLVSEQVESPGLR